MEFTENPSPTNEMDSLMKKAISNNRSLIEMTTTLTNSIIQLQDTLKATSAMSRDLAKYLSGAVKEANKIRENNPTDELNGMIGAIQYNRRSLDQNLLKLEKEYQEKRKKVNKTALNDLLKGEGIFSKKTWENLKNSHSKKKKLEETYNKKRAKAVKGASKVDKKAMKQLKEYFAANEDEFKKSGKTLEDFLKEQGVAVDEFADNLKGNKASVLDYLNAFNLNKVGSYFSSLSESSLDFSKKMVKTSSKTYKEVAKQRVKYMSPSLMSYADTGEFHATVMSELNMSSLEKSAQYATEVITSNLINGLEASDLSSIMMDINASKFDVKTLEKINLEIYNLSDNLNVSKNLLADTVNSMHSSTLAFTKGNIDLYDQMNSEILSSTAALADAVSSDFAKVMTSGISNFMDSTRSGIDYFKNITPEQQMFLQRGGSSALEAYNMVQSGDYAGLLKTYTQAVQNIDPNSTFGRYYGYNMLESMGIGDIYADWRSGNLSKEDLSYAIASAMDKSMGTDLSGALKGTSSTTGLFEKISNTMSNVVGPILEKLQAWTGITAQDVANTVIFAKMLKEVTSINKKMRRKGPDKEIGKLRSSLKDGFTDMKKAWQDNSGFGSKLSAVGATRFGGFLMRGMGLAAIVGTMVSAVSSFTKASKAQSEEEKKIYNTGGAIKVGGAVGGAALGVGLVAGGVVSGPVGWIIAGVVALIGLIVGAIYENSALSKLDDYSTDSTARLKRMQNQNEDFLSAQTAMFNNALRAQYQTSEKSFNQLLDETHKQYNILTKECADEGLAMANLAIATTNKFLTKGLDSAASKAVSNKEIAQSTIFRSIMEHSHKTGLDYVPYDNYPAFLHKGEAVLTSTQASSYRSAGLSAAGALAAISSATSGVLPSGLPLSSLNTQTSSVHGGTNIASISNLALNTSNKLLDLARDVIYDAETSNRDVSSVVANDRNGLSIGLGQWHNSRAFGLLRSLYAMDSAKFNLALSKFPDATILKDINTQSGNGYIPSETNISAIKAILTSFGAAPQNQQMAYDITGYLTTAKSKGFSDVMALIIASTIMHNIGNLNKFPAGNYNEHNILSEVSKYSTKIERARKAFNSLKTGAYAARYAELVGEIGTDTSKLNELTDSAMFASSQAQAAVMFAQDNLGAPYEGNGKPGSRTRSRLKGDAYNAFDCSSLVYRAYNSMGENKYMRGAPLGSATGSTATLYNTLESHGFVKLWDKNINNGGVYGDRSNIMALNPQPGDIILYGNGKPGRPLGINHTAIVENSSTQIHANGTVREDRLHPYKDGHLAAYFRQGTSPATIINPVKAEYAVGTPWVPDDQVAIIHKNEAIIPPEFNPYNNGVSVPLSSPEYDNSNVVEAIEAMCNKLLAMMSESDNRADRRQSRSNRTSPVDTAAKLLGRM